MRFIDRLWPWKSVAVKDLTENDIIVLMIGQTGVGKSTFINTATGQILCEVNKTLAPCTTEITHVRCSPPKHEGENDTASNPQHRIVFVDTPALTDSGESKVVEKKIRTWLDEASGKRGLKVSGILYFHKITDNRLTDPPSRHYKMFTELCGGQFQAKVLLVTTMWERVQEDIGEYRKTQLSKSWEQDGSAVLCHDGTHGSAWKIVGRLLGIEKL